jgi:replication factor C small subunit
MALWVEKYRPKEFSAVMGLPKEIPGALDNLPHFLFIGKPGTGKTTTAKIIIAKTGAETLTLNASDERGIQTIRDKVKNFAMTSSHNGKHKIVFLDECDALTNDAQTSLRNMMETYHNNCRFIATANYDNKIIEPLKSRFTVFRFEAGDEDVQGYLAKIVAAESVAISEAVLQEIVKRNKGDIRKCINQLQRLHTLGRDIVIEDLNKESLLPETIHNTLKAGDFVKARQILLDGNIEYDAFLDEYHKYIVELCIVKKQLTGTQFARIINDLADAISKINFVISKEIIVENFLLKTMGVLKNG